MADCCDCGNEPLGSIKCGKFFGWLRNCQLLRNDYISWSSMEQSHSLVGWGGWIGGWFVGKLAG